MTMSFYSPQKSSVEVISNIQTSLPLLKSESIYYGCYPYRVELEGHTFDNRRNLRDFKREVEDFMEDFEIFDFRTYISANAQRFYFRYKDDLVSYIGFYHKYIKNIRGPMDSDHLDQLYEPNLTLNVRDKLYYGKYDSKVSFTNKWSTYSRFISPFSKNYSQRLKAMEEEISEIINFVGQNVSQIKVTSYRPYHTNFFCTYDEIKDIVPFIELQGYSLALDITKCLLEDK